MTEESLSLYAIVAAVATGLAAAVGEWAHARRVARTARLAFGLEGAPRRWTKLVPFLRVPALALLAWALVTLFSYDRALREGVEDATSKRRLLVLLDVSPSMYLGDAGERGDEPRRIRGYKVLKSVLDRMPDKNVLYTVAGFYTEARPMVKDCRERALVLHFAGETPFALTFEPGKSDLLKSLNKAGDLVKEHPAKSTTVIVISDGDSVPPKGLNPMPASVDKIYFFGVGDTAKGTSIDGHVSRQDRDSLSQLARRLGGEYHNVNKVRLPDEVVDAIARRATASGALHTDRRWLALVLTMLASVILCILPLALEYAGAPGSARRRSRPSEPRAP